MKANYKGERSAIRFLLLLAVLGSVATIVYLILLGNMPQVFLDVVTEKTAIDGSNKSIERTLVYLLIIGGLISYTLYYMIIRRKKGNIKNIISDFDLKSYVAVFGVISMNLFLLVIYNTTNLLLLGGLLVVIISFIFRRQVIFESLACFFVSVYAISAIYRLYIHLGGGRYGNLMLITIVSIIITIVGLLPKKSMLFYRAILLLLQIVVPFNLLVFIANRYSYQGQIISIDAPFAVELVIWSVIIIFIFKAILLLIHKWNNKVNSITDIISLGTCATIMAFNSFTSGGNIISADLHHPFENIIAYFQVVDQGQNLFTEFIPVSGLYSFFQGFFLSFFGNGQMTNYLHTKNLISLLVIIIIVALLKKQMRSELVLFVSLVFTIIYYNRVLFIIPIMLLLSYKKLINNKNLWLKLWVVTTLLHGLYYPVNGAAVGVAFLPLGLWQLVTYIKSDEFKIAIKKPTFYLWWLMVIGIVISSIPLLIKMLHHTVAMSAQTIYADGISRFAQGVPGNFFNYLNNNAIRIALYVIFSFMIVAAIVWVAYALVLKIANIKYIKGKLTNQNTVDSLIALSIVIMVVISLTYTIVRLDFGVVYERSRGLILASFVMLMLLVNNNKFSKLVTSCVVIFCIFIVTVDTSIGTLAFSNDIRLQPYYTVNDDYALLDGSENSNVGNGFMNMSRYNDLMSLTTRVESLDLNQSYYAMFPIFSNYGYFYMFGLKGDGLIESYATRGYEAIQESVDTFKDNGTVIGAGFSSVNNYYLYNWLLTSGDYVWSADTATFNLNNDNLDINQVREINKQFSALIPNQIHLGKTPNSWGKSMESLKKIMSTSNVDYEKSSSDDETIITFKQPISGLENDFVYIELGGLSNDVTYRAIDGGASQSPSYFEQLLLQVNYNNNLTVEILFDDGTTSVLSNVGTGQILMPLGSSKTWLLNNHDNITIRVTDENNNLVNVSVDKIEFYKLQTIK